VADSRFSRAAGIASTESITAGDSSVASSLMVASGACSQTPFLRVDFAPLFGALFFPTGA
jgi:hypothetical protein